MIPQGTLTTIITDKIARVEFSHPSGNSFPSALLQKLTDELHDLSNNSLVSLIILQSSGNGPFCAGASFDELLAIEDLDQGSRFFSGFANVINAMRKCTKLIVGRIHGKAVGGGVGLASACDYVFATNNSAVKLSELAIGIGPFVIAPAVERKIGISGLAELTLAAHEWKSAEWAKQRGLFSEVFESATEMDTAITDFTSKLAAYNPDALEQMKKALWHDTDHWGTLLYQRAAISGNLVLSEFTKSALQQFKK